MRAYLYNHTYTRTYVRTYIHIHTTTFAHSTNSAQIFAIKKHQLDFLASSLYNAFDPVILNTFSGISSCWNVMNFIVQILRLPNPTSTLSKTTKGGYLVTAKASTAALIAASLSDFVIAYGDNSKAMQNFTFYREANINTALLALSQAILSNLQGGQSAVNLTMPYVRVSLLKPTVSALHSAKISAPATTVETFYGSSPPYITLGAKGLDNCFLGKKYASVAVAQWGAYPYSNLLTWGSPVQVQNSINQLDSPFSTSMVSILATTKAGVVNQGDSYTVTLKYTGPQVFSYSTLSSLVHYSFISNPQVFGTVGTQQVIPSCAQYTGRSNFSFALCKCSVVSYTSTTASLSCPESTNLCSATAAGGVIGEGIKMSSFVVLFFICFVLLLTLILCPSPHFTLVAPSALHFSCLLILTISLKYRAPQRVASLL